MLLTVENKLKILYKVLSLIIIILWCILGIFSVYGIFLKKHVYPVKYKDIVFEAAEQNNLERTLIFSVIKIESGFNEKAKSKKGALGLMQITPSTGEYIAKMLNVKQYDLLQPETNVKFGCYYLKYLINRFKNTETALCAYNAGESTVSIWLNNPDYSDDKIALKSIPFSETNEYINKYKKTFSKYKKIYGYILDK